MYKTYPQIHIYTQPFMFIQWLKMSQMCKKVGELSTFPQANCAPNAILANLRQHKRQVNLLFCLFGFSLCSNLQIIFTKRQVFLSKLGISFA